MAGLKVLFDTNILIDYLNGIPAARKEIERHRDAAISIVTWMEVMVGAQPGEQDRIRTFLSTFATLPLTAKVAEIAVTRRRERRFKLPDAIIFATAELEGRLLVTRNTKDFASDDPAVRVPYTF